MEVGDFPVKDKVVLVTGGGSGICTSFSKQASELGAKVIIGDLALGDEAQKLVDGSDGNVIFKKTDVTNWKELNDLVSTAKDKFGSTPDVYIAGAGIFEPPWSSFWHDKEEERYVNIDININHCLKLTRIAMDKLVSEDRKGVVLPIASVGGLAAAYHVPLYIASKHAIVGFVKSMKPAEQYEGVKVVTICPGAVDTPLWSPDRRERVAFHNIESLNPDDVAKEMINLVQDGKYGGGTVLEIMANHGPKTRVVPEWNISKPEGGTSTAASAPGEVPRAHREAKEIMDKIRGSAKK